MDVRKAITKAVDKAADVGEKLILFDKGKTTEKEGEEKSKGGKDKNS